jgi:4-alpha-glucanotransferase
LSKFHLVLLIHAHQPIGNFDDVYERAYRQSYLPFLEVLARHPSIRIGLHYSGPLLEWIEARHPDYIELLRRLVVRGQVELVGGGLYEPILIAIPVEDRLEQIHRLAAYLEGRFGRRPSGAWLAERVWEPALPATFAQAAVDYTLVDDTHFLASGLDPEQLYGYYLVEELGAAVKVIPGLKVLRYLIPYRSAEENLEFLRAAAERHPEGMAASGDDLEKFGLWPETYEHCYRDGWLERFFSALEAASAWLEVTAPGTYVAAHPPLGRAALPTAAYAEMMEWALPTAAHRKLENLEREFAARPDVLAFLRGGFWRNFLVKYPEANLLHKKMLYVAGRIERLPSAGPAAGAREQARTHLLRSQCNDAYWHGIFGGLYAPHLRTALWQELVRAEKVLASAEHGGADFAELDRLDFDLDGYEEIYLRSSRYTALLKPSAGATLAALDFPPRETTLVNSLARRAEAYHARLRDLAQEAPRGVASIHEQTRVKEPGLEKHLRYDRWARHAFRLLLFDPAKRLGDYAAVALDEDAQFAAGAFRIERASPGEVLFAAEGRWTGETEMTCRKRLRFRPVADANGFEIECALELRAADSAALELAAGLELVLNFLAPNEPDRYFEFSDARRPLAWGGAVPGGTLRIVDGWQKVAIELNAAEARELWIAPIETVSESEGGFERVYQGSGILAVWPVRLDPARPWSARLILRVSGL